MFETGGNILFSNEKYELIELLALHEEALADVYQAAENKFKNKEIWKYLVSEEKKHAMWIRSILGNVIDGSVKFEKGQITAKLYTDSIAKLSEEKTAIRSNLRTLSEVFDFAVAIENDIIEKNFLEIFKSKHKGIQGTINSLKSDTESHKELLNKAFNRFKEQKARYVEEKLNKVLEEKKEEERKKAVEAEKAMKGKKKLKEVEEHKQNEAELSEAFSALKEIAQVTEEEKEVFEEIKAENSKALNEKLDIIFENYHYIGLHSEYERLLSNLYKLFEKIFPNDELWAFMAEEERKHEFWLKDIMRKLNEGVIIFKAPKYPVDKVREAIINVAEIIEYCKAYKLSHKEAYQIAIQQESSMLENKFLNNFSSDAPAVESVFTKLIEDTIEHREWLKKKMKFYIYDK